MKSLTPSKDWLTKQKSHRLWKEIDDYVQNYLADHLDEQNDEWVTTWHNHYRFLQNPDIPFVTFAVLIAEDPDASLQQVATSIITLIPHLENYLEILEETTKGGIAYFFKDYNQQQFTKHQKIKLDSKPSDTTSTSVKEIIEVEDVEEDDDQLVIEEEVIFEAEEPPLTQQTPKKDLQSELQAESTPTVAKPSPNILQKGLSQASKVIKNLKYTSRQIENPSDPISDEENLSDNNDIDVSDDDEDKISDDNTSDDDQQQLLKTIRKNKYAKHTFNKKVNKFSRLLKEYDFEQILEGPSVLQQTFDTLRVKFEKKCNAVSKAIMKDFKNDTKEHSTFFTEACNREIDDYKKELHQWMEKEKLKFMSQLRSDLNSTNHTNPFQQPPPTSSNFAQNNTPTFGNNNPSNIPHLHQHWGPVPSPSHPHPSTPGHQNTSNDPSYQPPFYSKYAPLTFQHFGRTCVMMDKEYSRSTSKTPFVCESADDGLAFYNTIQRSAIPYNIMLQPINEIRIWDFDPNTRPTTCGMEFRNDQSYFHAYQAAATALHSRITRADFSKVPIYDELIKDDIRTGDTDGFKLLYKILTMCHPALIKRRSSMVQPTLPPNGNFFAFVRKLENWIVFESISHRQYNDEWKLEYVMEAMKNDGRFEESHSQLQNEFNLHKMMKSQNPVTATFPKRLQLEQLPYTIMSMYKDPSEKLVLFGERTSTTDAISNKLQAPSVDDDDFSEDTTAFINKFSKKQPRTSPRLAKPSNTTRQRLNKICECCGIFGHNVHDNGCDLAATFIKTSKFVKENPSIARKVIPIFEAHQNKRMVDAGKRTSTTSFKDRFKSAATSNRLKITPAIKALISSIDDALYNDDDDEDDLYHTIDLETYDNNDEFHDSHEDTQH